MKTIVVTGADGFIGLHTRFFLHEREKKGEVTVIALDRAGFSNVETLTHALQQADAVIHLAGVNKGSDAELEGGNIELAKALTAACESAKITPHIVYASSLHEDKDTPYGRGKKGAGEVIEQFAATHASKATVAVLPHVFGEFAKPDYNSAVATFVRDIAEGRESQVNESGEVQLAYVRDVAQTLVEAIDEGTTGRLSVPGEAKNIGEVYRLLVSFADEYKKSKQPAVASTLELALFNTLHSALFPNLFPLTLTLHSDERGTLFEIVRSGRTDEMFYSTTKPGKIRGNHYHTRKMERFCVVAGKATINLRRLLDDKIVTFTVSGDTPVAVDMPTYYVHNLTNVGDAELQTVFWVSEPYDASNPDSFPEVV